MPDREAIERGLTFENYISEVLDMTLQPGSGNKFFARGDCVGHGLLVSCKSEKNLTWAKIHKHLKEAIDLANGTGNISALAIESDEGYDALIVMTPTAFAKALQEVKIPETFESKGIEKRNKADIPIMLR